MRKFYLLMFSFLFVFQVFAQEDSLKTNMAHFLSVGDSLSYAENAFALFEYQISQGKSKEALGMLEDALEIAPKEDTIYYQMASNFHLQSYYFNGQLKSDLHLLDTAIAYYNNDDFYHENVVMLYMYAGGTTRYHGNYTKARDYYLSALDIWNSREGGNYNQKLECYNNIMLSEGHLQNYESALSYARAGIDIIPKVSDYSLVIAHYIDNSVLLFTLGQQETSNESVLRGWEIAQQHGNDYEKAYTNINKSYVDIKNKKYDIALKQIDESKIYYTSVEDKKALLNIEKIRATILKETGDTVMWKKIIDARLEMCRDTTSYNYLCRSTFYEIATDGVGILSMTFRDSLLAEQINFSKRIDDYVILSNSYYSRADLANEMNDFEKSNQYLFKYIEMEDTIKNAQFQESLAEEKTKQNIEDYEYKTQQAELEANLLKKRNQLVITILIALISLFVAGIYFYKKLSSSQKKIAEQNLQLQQLNETKDRFFGIIAHDLRSPISALDGVGQQMAYYLKKNDIPKLNLLSERVDLTAKNMSDLLDNLLSWALLQKGMIAYNPQSVNVFNAVSETISLFREVANLKGVTLKNLVGESLEVYADESALATILRNLVHNAVKFTDAGGEVTVNAEQKGNRVFIVINDTGTGIGAEAISKLFDVSHRSQKGTKGEKGTGLGLTLCKEMIELNKGSIRVTSELGLGSAFVFDLPIKSRF